MATIVLPVLTEAIDRGGAMQIIPELGVFWRNNATLQIGLDPRVRIWVDGLTRHEQSLVSLLTRDHTIPELDRLAASHHVTPERLARILAMLRRAGVLREAADAQEAAGTTVSATIDPKLAVAEANLEQEPKAATACISSAVGHLEGAPATAGDKDPAAAQLALINSDAHPRTDCRVRICGLDPLGVAIGLSLATQGIGTILFSDPQPVGAADHCALWPRWQGLPRERAFLTALRQVNPRIRTGSASGGNSEEAHLSVVTGSRLANPRSTMHLMASGTPHMLLWTEDIDVCVGPLVEPHRSACAECLYKERLEEDACWALLAAQAAGSAPLVTSGPALGLAASLATHAILSLLDGLGNPLQNRQWRVPPLPEPPYQVEVQPHSSCGCTSQEPRLQALTQLA
ncbi:hypothetical protein [Actinobaculum sp. 352]|uniref:hypothetical protein n=1 Tax=Actinobaculum sp. 352 TaxID=2490946 RepID=UPI000F7FA210|nr:hypothetical protein [Actinobaculum sp. 352]RTE49053.1 hypothetical protein EKN07_07960 [Actinobaculum sp. 352]